MATKDDTLTRPAAPDAVRGLVERARQEAYHRRKGHHNGLRNKDTARLLEDLASALAAPVADGGESVVEKAMAYLHPHLNTGTFAAPGWAIQLASILTGGDGCGTPVEPTPPADAEQRARDVADSLYGWMVEVMPNGGLLNAAVVCDYAGQQHFKRDLAKQVAQALRERPAQVEAVAERHNLYGIRWIKQLRDMKPGTQWFIEGRAEPIATVTSSAGVLWHMAESEIPHGTKYYTTPPPAVDVAVLREVIAGLVSEIERETCQHEETHRGGAIWEICNQCGAKWADDQGGRPDFKWSPVVERAHAILAHPATCGQGVRNEG